MAKDPITSSNWWSLLAREVRRVEGVAERLMCGQCLTNTLRMANCLKAGSKAKHYTSDLRIWGLNMSGRTIWTTQNLVLLQLEHKRYWMEWKATLPLHILSCDMLGS